MNGNFDSQWLAAKLERSLELERVERLRRMGWPPPARASWLTALRRTFTAGRTTATEQRPVHRLSEREEAVARGL